MRFTATLLIALTAGYFGWAGELAPVDLALAAHQTAIEKANAEYGNAVGAANAQLVSDLKHASQQPGADKISIYESILMFSPNDAETKGVLLAERTNAKLEALASENTNVADDPNYPASEGWKKSSDGIWWRVRPSNVITSKKRVSSASQSPTKRKTNDVTSSGADKKLIEQARKADKYVNEHLDEYREKHRLAELRAARDPEFRAAREQALRQLAPELFMPTTEDAGRFQPIIDAARNKAIREAGR